MSKEHLSHLRSATVNRTTQMRESSLRRNMGGITSNKLKENTDKMAVNYYKLYQFFVIKVCI